MVLKWNKYLTSSQILIPLNICGQFTPWQSHRRVAGEQTQRRAENLGRAQPILMNLINYPQDTMYFHLVFSR